MLRCPSDRHRIRNLDRIQQHLWLPAYPSFLDTEATFQMSRSICNVVLQRRYEYLDGFHHHDSTNASHPRSQSAAEAETSTHCDLCSRRLVSESTPLLHVSLSVSRGLCHPSNLGNQAVTVIRCTIHIQPDSGLSHILFSHGFWLPTADNCGFSVCLVSIMRLHSLVAISNSPDPTFDNPPAATWSSSEANISIVCSCLPCLRPLIIRHLPGVFSTTSGSNRSWFCNGNKGVRHSVRSAFSAYRGEGKNVSTTINSEDMFDMHHIEDRDSIIQVVTEIHITVEKKRKSQVQGIEPV